MHRIAAVLAAALLAGFVSPAAAYRYSCSEWTQADPSSRETFVDGVIDMTAGLLCFVGDDRCACLQDAWSHAAEDVAGAISTCASGTDGDAWAQAFVGALNACAPGAPGTITGEYSQTCSDWQADASSGDAARENASRGFYEGVTDMVAGLMCFVGDERCDCLQNASDDPTFRDPVESQLMQCSGELPAFGTAFTAALNHCGQVAAGQALYETPHEDGNTFACGTCHALAEPAPDGIRRPGHPIGNAAARTTWKNGQLGSLLDAVNTCRTEWMAAPPFTAGDERWQALLGFLESTVNQSPAPDLDFDVVAPPTDLGGGDPMAGQQTFNGTCAVCHGADAVGSERAPMLRGDFLDAELIARRVRTSGLTNSVVYDGLTGGRMPFWAADRLSDDELRDLIAFVLATDGEGGGTGGMDGLRSCDSTHPSIGQVADLSTFAHQVSGRATIIDDCTIRIDDFVYDGTGINVQWYSGLDGDYRGGFSMSGDIRRAVPYDGETVFAQLPEGRTLDELDGISVWCVPVAASFGDGLFGPP